MRNKIEYLNKALNNNLNYEGPKLLYKYRPFDEYTFDMLEKKYLFLCKASNLDDKLECSIDLNLDEEKLKKNIISKIQKKLLPYMSKDDRSLLENKLLCYNYNDEMMSKINYFNELLKGDQVLNKQLENLIKIGLDAKENIGICSLSDSPNIEKLWNNYYAGYDSGYCIEYIVSDYEYNKCIFPVVYIDERDNDLINTLTYDIMGQFTSIISNGKICMDKSHYLRIYLTKKCEWEYQSEWRLIGDSNSKIDAPKINRIIVGNNINNENLEKLTRFCNKSGIKLVERNKLIK
ncbi:putative uncharacterized protein [Coprobacillus sp. CAG:698]|nr:putative uncharacterized protein [Coprobacillus sp. CAG:698]